MKRHGSIGHVELILQSCPSENGAAALAMVLSYFGKHATMRELTAQPIASAADLIAAAQSRGIYAQGYQMTYAQLLQAPLPLVVHWKFRSFVVVTGLQGGKVEIHSPEEGHQTLSRRAFEAGFTGVAICFADGEPVRRRGAAGPVRSMLAEGAALPVLLGTAQLFLAACSVALAVLCRSIATQLSAPQTGGGLSLCLALGAVVVLQLAALAFQVWLVWRWRILRRIRSARAFQERMDSESAAFFEKTRLFRLDEAVRSCDVGSSAAAWGILCLTQLVSGGVCLAVMAVQSLAAAVAAFLVAAVFAGFCLWRRERLYSDGKLLDRAAFLTEDLAEQDLAAWEEIRLRGEDRARFQRWAGEAGGACRPEEVERQKGCWYAAAAVELLVVLCVCLLQMIAGQAGTADLLGCMALAGGAAASMGALPCLLTEQAAARRARESAGTLFQEETEARVPSGAAAAETLTVQNVSTRPAADGVAALRDVTFTVRRGEILVVVGDKAARSALASILSGLEQPAQGQLYLDSRNGADLSDREIYESITLLGGGLPFPRGTVRENIAAGFPDITDYAVMEAASDALLHQRVLLRSERYDTPVSTFSGGERVLLEFARAFARGAPFLVCNDLTGCLDAETEDQLIRNLRRRGMGAVLLTGDGSLLRKGDIACRIVDGRTALRERSEFVEEVYDLA